MRVWLLILFGALTGSGLTILCLQQSGYIDIRLIYCNLVSGPPADSGQFNTVHKYTARVPIPGHPIDQCIGPNRVLDDAARRCHELRVITVTANEPFDDGVERAAAFLRGVCEGTTEASPTKAQQADWCRLHERMKLYGHKIRPVSGSLVR